MLSNGRNRSFGDPCYRDSGHIRIDLSLAFEELLSGRPLQILPVVDLEPLRRVLQVGSELALCDDAFEISLAGECEQPSPVASGPNGRTLQDQVQAEVSGISA